MPEPKGDKLFVNIGASQARRRLKGFGHGVRKIQSAGRNKAVVIHTATGKHLSVLESQFADVGFADREADLDESIANLRNLGPASVQWLHQAGIHTLRDLRECGASAAYLRVKHLQPKASLNLLWALAAGLQDRDWRELRDDEKERLLAAVRL
jgi:DNA transformation protein and related proteins